MKKLKVKIITGFRKDQEYTIDVEEAHKAYYLFLHPNERGVFNNGLALIGQQIQKIEPDYNATMGWSQTHLLDSDDYNEITRSGVDKEIQAHLLIAKNIAQSDSISEHIKMPLSEAKLLLVDNMS